MDINSIRTTNDIIPASIMLTLSDFLVLVLDFGVIPGIADVLVGRRALKTEGAGEDAGVPRVKPNIKNK